MAASLPPGNSLGGQGSHRFGLLRDYFQDNAHEGAWRGFEEAVEGLRDAGAEVAEAPLPGSFEVVHAAHRVIMASEAASVHEENFRDRMSDYRVNVRGLVASGMLVPASAYIRAQRIRGRFTLETTNLLKDVDCILTPSATAPAPHGLEYTGDPAFNAPWSFCGFPAITVPSGLDKDGLPLGIQLIGRPFHVARLFEAARWCEKVLDFPKEPRDPV